MDKSLAILLGKKWEKGLIINISDAKGNQLADICVENTTRYSPIEFLFYLLTAWIKYVISVRGGGWLANDKGRFKKKKTES